MKKALVIAASVCMLCTAIYGTFATQSRASNNPEREEYYYNEDEWEKAERLTYSSVAEKRNGEQETNTTFIDTIPDSTTVLINKEFSLPEDYIPENMVVPNVPFSFSGYKEKKLMREDAAKALEALFKGGEEAGVSLFAVSGYRSYERQKEIYDANVARNGSERTNMFSAKPGYSEHQSGLAMDVSTNSVQYRLDEAFAGTPEGRFLADHAYEYGFIIRYPENKSDITGYSYEPWHIRYVGETMAKELHDRGITMEEYYHYTPSEELQQEETYGTAVDVEEIEEEY